MEDIYDWKGLNGQLVTFKKEVGEASKITYIGSPRLFALRLQSFSHIL